VNPREQEGAREEQEGAEEEQEDEIAINAGARQRLVNQLTSMRNPKFGVSIWNYGFCPSALKI
jgi:hypothetical protein